MFGGCGKPEIAGIFFAIICEIPENLIQSQNKRTAFHILTIKCSYMIMIEICIHSPFAHFVSRIKDNFLVQNDKGENQNQNL